MTTLPVDHKRFEDLKSYAKNIKSHSVKEWQVALIALGIVVVGAGVITGAIYGVKALPLRGQKICIITFSSIGAVIGVLALGGCCSCKGVGDSISREEERKKQEISLALLNMEADFNNLKKAFLTYKENLSPRDYPLFVKKLILKGIEENSLDLKLTQEIFEKLNTYDHKNILSFIRETKLENYFDSKPQPAIKKGSLKDAISPKIRRYLQVYKASGAEFDTLLNSLKKNEADLDKVEAALKSKYSKFKRRNLVNVLGSTFVGILVPALAATFIALIVLAVKHKISKLAPFIGSSIIIQVIPFSIIAAIGLNLSNHRASKIQAKLENLYTCSDSGRHAAIYRRFGRIIEDVCENNNQLASKFRQTSVAQ